MSTYDGGAALAVRGTAGGARRRVQSSLSPERSLPCGGPQVARLRAAPVRGAAAGLEFALPAPPRRPARCPPAPPPGRRGAGLYGSAARSGGGRGLAAAVRRALGGDAVGVNIHQHVGPAGDPTRQGTGANMRVFELAAVGTPQRSDAKADIARHVTPGREVVLYRSIAELRARAHELLADEPTRRSLAAAARERALREHTWRHRLEELLTVALR